MHKVAGGGRHLPNLSVAVRAGPGIPKHHHRKLTLAAAGSTRLEDGHLRLRRRGAGARAAREAAAERGARPGGSSRRRARGDSGRPCSCSRRPARAARRSRSTVWRPRRGGRGATADEDDAANGTAAVGALAANRRRRRRERRRRGRHRQPGGTHRWATGRATAWACAPSALMRRVQAHVRGVKRSSTQSLRRRTRLVQYKQEHTDKSGAQRELLVALGEFGIHFHVGRRCRTGTTP